jgi:hypothetical protein
MFGNILKNSVQKKCNNCLLLIKSIMSQQIKDLIAEKSRFITNEIIQQMVCYINEDSTMDVIKKKIFHPTLMYTANYLYAVVLLMLIGIWMNTVVLFYIFFSKQNYDCQAMNCFCEFL